MDNERYLQPLEIISFLVDRGGRATNCELIENFKHLLNKTTEIGQTNFAFLKRIARILMIVKKINGSKYFQLKQEFQGISDVNILRYIEENYGREEVSNFGTLSRSRQPIYDPESLSEAEYFVTPKEIGSSRESGLENSHSIEIEIEPLQDDKLKKCEPNLKISGYGKPRMPLPTEKVEEAELEDSDELSSLPILRKADQYKSLNRQKTSVKDLSQKYEAQITENQNIANSSKQNVKTERTKKISIRQSFNNENDMYPYLPLDLSMKEWIREASRNNEDYIRREMTSNPEIVRTRDPSTGYTVLHWAARKGNTGLIHQLIGRHGMDVNLRTRGGYTPLMLAAIHGKISVYNMLLNPYAANPDLRDYSGRKAYQYLPPSESFENDLPDGNRDDRAKIRRGRVDKSSTFIRGLARTSFMKPKAKPKFS